MYTTHICLSFVLVLYLSSSNVQCFQKGMSYLSWGEPRINSDQSKISLQDLQQTKTEWIALIITWYQDTINATTIGPDAQSYKEEEIEEFIMGSLAIGYEVMLKPHVDPKDGHWRALIGSQFTSPAMWQEWFKSYSAFILRYAEVAQRWDLPQYCIGVEMITASSHEKEFRTLIAEVRKIYKGNVTYAANWGTEYEFLLSNKVEDIHGEIDDIKWLDALDIIGVDAYYFLTTNVNPSKAELVEAWAPIRTHLANISTTYKKKIIFTEIGYRSIEGAAVHPGWWNITAPVNETQQAVCYDAVFTAFNSQTWWEGVYWWNWFANPEAGGPKDIDFTPQAKQAQDVLTKYYEQDNLKSIKN